MLTILTTDEFAEWFASLDDPAAEEVAAGVELIRELGPERAPPHSRDSLLWYQSTPAARAATATQLPGRLAFDGDFMEFARCAQDILAHLDSELVRERLGRAGPEQQRRASTALTEIHDLARRHRLYLSFLRGGAERSFERLLGSYRIVLQAVDVAPVRKPANTEALRELNLREHSPGMRVLYGVDVQSERALLVSGEPLDRQAYGRSVRRALRVWQQFLVNESDDAWERALQPRNRP